jgi:hypothetical protein
MLAMTPNGFVDEPASTAPRLRSPVARAESPALNRANLNLVFRRYSPDTINMTQPVIAIVLIASGLLDTQSQPGRTTDAGLYRLTTDWISATAAIAEAQRDFTTAANDASGSPESMLAQMTANRKGALKLQDALRRLPMPSAYPAESIERTSVDSFRTVITALVDTLNEGFSIQKKIVMATTREDLASLMASVAEFTAKIDEAGKMVPLVAVSLTYSFIDRNRVTNGKLRHLRFTAAQRRELLQDMKREFPMVGNSLDVGQSNVDASIAVLRTVLSGNHRSADDPE